MSARSTANSNIARYPSSFNARNVTFGAPPPPKGGPIIQWIRSTKVFTLFVKSTVYKVVSNENVQKVFYWTVLGFIIFTAGSLGQQQIYKMRDYRAGQSIMMTSSQMKHFGNLDTKQKNAEEIMESLYNETIAGKDLDDWDNVRHPRKEEPDTIVEHVRREEARKMKAVQEQVKGQLEVMEGQELPEGEFEYVFDYLDPEDE